MRRYLQFRLRSLLGVVTLAAVGCAVVGGMLRERQADLQALSAIQAGRVQVEDASTFFQPYQLL